MNSSSFLNPTPSRAGMDRVILRLAIPATTSSVLRGTFTFVDAWWCGREGPDSLAAFGAASFYAWALIALSLTASVGIASRVAQATGARDRERASRAARDGLSASFLVAAITGGLFFVFAPNLVAFQGVTDEVAAGGIAYLRALSLGAPAYFAHDAADAALRGTGDTRTPAIVGAFAALLNVALDPLFLFGFGPIPALGVGGVGVATVVLHGLTACVLWTVIRRRRGIVGGRPELSGMRQTVRIGLPSATLGVGFSLVYVALTPAVAAFGTVQIAALAIGHRLESFAYMTNAGFAASAQALVGQRLGAGKDEEARYAARRTAILASLVTGTFTVTLFVFAGSAAGFFSTDAAVVSAGAVYATIIAFSIVPQTVEMVLTGAFEGAGDTVPPLLVGTLTHGIRIPLVYLVTDGLGLGIESVWWVISGCSIAAGLAMAAMFRWRRWKPVASASSTGNGRTVADAA